MGYAWHFTCDLPSRTSGEYFFFFPIRFVLNCSIEMKDHVVTQSSNAAGKTIKKQGVPTKSKSSATRATRESTNSTVIKQSNNSRGTLLLARLLWSILESSSNMVSLITQEYMTLQSVLRTLQSILSMQALLPLQSLSILNTMSTPRARHRLSSTLSSLSQGC